jgi:hypothetical protein
LPHAPWPSATWRKLGMLWKRLGGSCLGSLKNERAETDGVGQSVSVATRKKPLTPCDDERNRRPIGATMMTGIIVSHEQAKEIFKAINGIGELLKRLPSKPEDAPVKHAIMSNLTLIQMNLTGMPRTSSN